jgi:hypothetical protein
MLLDAVTNATDTILIIHVYPCSEKQCHVGLVIRFDYQLNKQSAERCEFHVALNKLNLYSLIFSPCLILSFKC